METDYGDTPAKRLEAYKIHRQKMDALLETLSTCKDSIQVEVVKPYCLDAHEFRYFPKPKEALEKELKTWENIYGLFITKYKDNELYAMRLRNTISKVKEELKQQQDLLPSGQIPNEDESCMLEIDMCQQTGKEQKELDENREKDIEERCKYLENLTISGSDKLRRQCTHNYYIHEICGIIKGLLEYLRMDFLDYDACQAKQYNDVLRGQNKREREDNECTTSEPAEKEGRLY